MEKNDDNGQQSLSPLQKKRSQIIANSNFVACFQIFEKENRNSPRKRKSEDGISFDSERPSHRFGTPNSILDKFNHCSPRKTTCDKNNGFSESPIFAWLPKSSAKRIKCIGQTPVSIFQDSNEKQSELRDQRPDFTAFISQGQNSLRNDFILPELDRQDLNINLFDSPLIFGQHGFDKDPNFNIFLPGLDGFQFSEMSKEPRTIPQPGKCNCRNSQCLKMYCDCLKRGDFCNGCNCIGCENHQTSEVRKVKIDSLFEKQKKVANSVLVLSGDDLKDKVLKSGCNCRKNSCMKKYCECHQFGLKCGKSCRCISCHNGKEEGESNDKR